MTPELFVKWFQREDDYKMCKLSDFFLTFSWKFVYTKPLKFGWCDAHNKAICIFLKMFLIIFNVKINGLQWRSQEGEQRSSTIGGIFQKKKKYFYHKRFMMMLLDKANGDYIHISLALSLTLNKKLTTWNPHIRSTRL